MGKKQKAGQSSESERVAQAGVRQYDAFFKLYAKSVREKKAFRSLGYIPGPAVILDIREGGEVRILDATSDVAEIIGTIPTPWMAWEELPVEIQEGLAEHKAVVDELGYEPSPFNLGLATALLDDRAPAKYLAAGMPRFRYRGRDPELPFGVALIPVVEGGELKGLKVHIYNPKGIPDCPPDGTLLTLAELKEGQGPVQKLLRTWALMERNYRHRYQRDGNRHQRREGNKSSPRKRGGKTTR